MAIRVEYCWECDADHFFCDTCSSRCCDHIGFLLWAGVRRSIRAPVYANASSQVAPALI